VAFPTEQRKSLATQRSEIIKLWIGSARRRCLMLLMQWGLELTVRVTDASRRIISRRSRRRGVRESESAVCQRGARHHMWAQQEFHAAARRRSGLDKDPSRSSLRVSASLRDHFLPSGLASFAPFARVLFKDIHCLRTGAPLKSRTGEESHAKHAKLAKEEQG
jgi:hypothetical protein